ncbi:hypothetical protein KIN20_005187 [Parelaphostrongylus tenuis]|uniref:Uncharacterized protein n=1 Tax=Parelaphostrongylus tenuis TaxID=148309 RepID=A0AAD5ML04_PARTN|nr:hypothetical protein KIN20_005187 [Parelaphostrongylus tenuis]
MEDMMLNKSLERGGYTGLLHATRKNGSVASARLSYSTSTGRQVIQYHEGQEKSKGNTAEIYKKLSLKSV